MMMVPPANHKMNHSPKVASISIRQELLHHRLTALHVRHISYPRLGDGTITRERSKNMTASIPQYGQRLQSSLGNQKNVRAARTKILNRWVWKETRCRQCAAHLESSPYSVSNCLSSCLLLLTGPVSSG